MLKKTLLVLFVLLAALGVGIAFSYTSLKLHSPVRQPPTLNGALVASVVVGLVLGAARGMLKKKNAIEGEVVTRHGVGSFISHWATGFRYLRR